MLAATSPASDEKRVALVCRGDQRGETVFLRWRNDDEVREEVELERWCGQLAVEYAVLKRGSVQ